MEKTVKGRKDYKCDQCEEPIKKGELSLVETFRAPKYVRDEQVGIEYVKIRMHSPTSICDKNMGYDEDGFIIQPSKS